MFLTYRHSLNKVLVRHICPSTHWIFSGFLLHFDVAPLTESYKGNHWTFKKQLR